MSGALGGQFGDLHLAIWIGETPDRSEAVFLLLTTASPSGARYMPAWAGALGLDPTPGAVTAVVDPELCRVTIGDDRWLRLIHSDDYITRQVGAEHAAMLRTQRRAVVAVGYVAMLDGAETFRYVERNAARIALGIVTAQPV